MFINVKSNKCIVRKHIKPRKKNSVELKMI